MWCEMAIAASPPITAIRLMLDLVQEAEAVPQYIAVRPLDQEGSLTDRQSLVRSAGNGCLLLLWSRSVVGRPEGRHMCPNLT